MEEGLVAPWCKLAFARLHHTNGNRCTFWDRSRGERIFRKSAFDSRVGLYIVDLMVDPALPRVVSHPRAGGFHQDDCDHPAVESPCGG